MGNTGRLVSAVLKHAGEQHEDTAWTHVTEAMTRYDIAAVVVSAEARTPRQAIRAMRDHLDSLLVLV
jgi:hypothetical protein